jgi:SAM-dependent methyltransferase
MDIFFEIHSDLPREGPGDKLSSHQAFAMIKDLPDNPLILDIGCGPGMQTFELAELTDGKIIAIDNHQPFLDQIQARVARLGLAGRIQVRHGSMFELNFPAQSFDLLWCEGAIYIIGFEEGLKTWRPLLKPGGSIAATEISWLKPDPPAEVLAYWMGEYLGMHSVDQNLEILRAAGYQETCHFSLPPASWWTDYYTPIQAKLPGLREKYRDDPAALECIDAAQKEMDIFHKYSDWYGYVFYVAQAGRLE